MQILAYDIDGDRIGVLVSKPKKGEKPARTNDRFLKDLEKRKSLDQKQAENNAGGSMLSGPPGISGPRGGMLGASGEIRP